MRANATSRSKMSRTRVSRKNAAARIAAWSQKEIDPDDRPNFAGYSIRPSEFAAWRQIWEGR
jgi:hypothetical protein